MGLNSLLSWNSFAASTVCLYRHMLRSLLHMTRTLPSQILATGSILFNRTRDLLSHRPACPSTSKKFAVPSHPPMIKYEILLCMDRWSAYVS